MATSTHTGQWLSGPPCPSHQLKQLMAVATSSARGSIQRGSRSSPSTVGSLWLAAVVVNGRAS